MTNKGFSLVIGADTSGLANALKDVNTKAKNSATELKQIENILKKSGDSAALWSQKQQVLTNKLNATNEKISILEQAQKGIEQRFRDGEIDKGAYDKFQNKLKKANDKLKDLSSQQAEIERQFKNNEIDQNAYEEFCKKLQKAQNEVKKLEIANHSMEENLKLGNISEEQYRTFQRELERTRLEAKNLSNEIDDAQQKIKNLGKSADDSADDVDELSGELEESGEQAEKSSDNFTVFKGALADLVADGIRMASTALKNLTTDIIQTGAEFESAMSKVGAISGATSDDLKRLSEKALEMGSATKFSASESAEAMSYMAMAGWKTEEMLDGIAGIMNLAAASGEELATTSDIVTDALTALGMSAADSAHFSDVLAAASSNANTNVSLLGESFKYSASLAGAMGASAEDLALALGLMANSGIKGTQAGNSLKNALVNLVRPTEQQAIAMQNLGLITTETARVFDDKAIEKAQKNFEKNTRNLEKAQNNYNSAVEKYGEESYQAKNKLIDLQTAENNLTESQENLNKVREGTLKVVSTGNSAITDEYGNVKSLKEIMDVLRETMESVNVELVDSDGNLKEYDSIIEELAQTEEGLTQAEQLKNASIIFGKQNLSGMLAIINASEQDYNKLAEAIYNCDGSAKSMSETMIDNLAGDMTIFKSAVEGAKISLSQKLNPALRDIVKYATQKVPEVQNLVEPFLNSAVSGVKKIIQNLPEIVNIIDNMIPAVTALAVSLAEIKLVSAVKSAISAVNGLMTAFKACTTVIEYCGFALNALPIVAVAGGVVALTAGVISLVNAQKSEKTVLDELDEKHQKELESLRDEKNAIDDLNKSFYENADSIKSGTSRTQELWEELQKLADATGNVRQKDKARADYILNELNNALGTEYTITGNQIENYKKLSAEIDRVIAKKQAEMMLDAYLANSSEMTKKRQESRRKYENYDRQFQDAKKERQRLEEEYERLTGRSADEIKVTLKEKDIAQLVSAENSKAEFELGLELLQAKNAENDFNSERITAKNIYNSTLDYFQKLSDAQVAISEERYSDIEKILYSEKDLSAEILDGTVTDAEKRLEAFEESLQKSLSDFRLAVATKNQYTIDEAGKSIGETMKLALISGKNLVEVWADYRENFEKLFNSGIDITGTLSWGVDSGVKIEDIVGDWKNVIQSQLNSGFDVSGLLKWAENSKHKISEIFSSDKDFVKYVNQQFREGLDVEYLLEWGLDSGLASSEEFVDIFKKTVEKNLKNGLNVGNLLTLGNENNIDLGEIFGENYAEIMRKLAENKIDLTDFIGWNESRGVSVAEAFGKNLKSHISKYISESSNSFINSMLKPSTEIVNNMFSEGNISKAIRTARLSGLTIGDVFGENYTKNVQSMIDKGYDVRELLVWAKESGFDVSEVFTKEYTAKFQKTLDEWYDIADLMRWAESSGVSIGELFGSNFHKNVNRYLYETNNSFQNFVNGLQEAVNSLPAFASGIAKSGLRGLGLPVFATGGFLGEGMGIVAEANHPELIEIVNGGARITPISDNKSNSVSENQKIFYSYYTVNATIANDYDVRKLAENLESEKRKIEMGVGF